MGHRSSKQIDRKATNRHRNRRKQGQMGRKGGVLIINMTAEREEREVTSLRGASQERVGKL